MTAKLDLVGTIRDANNDANLYSWRGVGDGTFEAAVSLGATLVLDLQVVNVNNDAYDDLVISDAQYHVSVRPGGPSGFGSAIVNTFDFYPSQIQLGNFNEGNSNVDLVVSTSGVFALYRGNGDGTFTEARRVTTAANDLTVDNTVADFDNDGRFDVAIAERLSEQVQIYFRNVDGTYASPVSLPAGTWPSAIATADFNHDGLTDLAAVNWDDGMINVYRNLGSRTFSRQTLSGKMPGVSYGNLNSIQLVDINADTNPDILAGPANGTAVATFLGEGNGSFRSATWSSFTSSVSGSIVTGNFDADSDLELATGSYQQLFIHDYSCATQVIGYDVNRVISTGQTAKFRAAVSGISSSIPAPLGTITFKEGATTFGTVDIDTNGFASLDYAGLGTGDHTVTAVFSGNSVVGTGTSAGFLERVVTTPSSITLTIDPSTHAEPFNVYATIMPRGNPGNDFYRLTIDGITESSDRYSSVPAVLTLNAGPHTISAEYPGGFFDPPASSPVYNITTAKHSVTLTKSGDTDVRQGTAHTIQISTNTPTSPTGSITLYRGATQVGSGAITNSVATITATLPRGAYEYTAVYAGDTNYLSGSTSFTLTVMANSPVAINARTAGVTVFAPALVPQGTTATTMYRRVHGTTPWSSVPSWSLGSPFDNGPFTYGVVYDYRLDATVSAQLQQSNIDTAVVYTDTTLDTGATQIKLAHFTELRDAINALRATASLPPFAFDGTFGPGAMIGASHLSAMRTAVIEARSVLGMAAPAFTDPSPAGATVKRAHITELRDSAD
jgi:hypothetical protein